MATAPDWTEDEKKRRRASLTRYDLGQSQYIADTAGRAAALAQGEVLPELRYDPATGRGTRAQGNVPGGRSNSFGRRIERAILGTPEIPELAAPASDRAAPTEIPLSDPRNQFSGKVFDSRSDLSTTNLKGAGLQRVVKTADGTYTDAPSATGDVRYYNEFGRRADVGDVNYDHAGLSGPDAVAAHLAAENAAQLDMSKPENARLVLERGREAQRQMADRQQQVAARQQMEFLAGLDPADRAEMLTEQSKTNALTRNAAAQNAVTMRGQDLVAGTAAAARRTADEAALSKQDIYEREWLARDPEGYIRDQLGSLSGLSEDDMVRALSDPKNPKTSRLREALRLAAVAGGADRNFRPGASTKTSLLRKVFTLGAADDYNDGAGFLGNTYDAPAGLTDAQWEAIMRADRQPRN